MISDRLQIRHLICTETSGGKLNAVCSVLNLYELVHGIFNDLFIPFEHKQKGKSMSTGQAFA